MKLSYAVLGALLPACGFSITADGAGPADARSDAAADARADAPLIDAMPPIDAPPDAPPAWTDIDTLTVPCTGGTVMSNVTLSATVMYRLRASGTCVANNENIEPSRADAEYIGYNYQSGPYDSYDNIDTGIAVNDLTPGMSKLPRWGAYTATHVYEQPWVGAGAPITASYHESNLANNEGTLTLTIQAFQ